MTDRRAAQASPTAIGGDPQERVHGNKVEHATSENPALAVVQQAYELLLTEIRGRSLLSV